MYVCMYIYLYIYVCLRLPARPCYKVPTLNFFSRESTKKYRRLIFVLFVFDLYYVLDYLKSIKYQLLLEF